LLLTRPFNGDCENEALNVLYDGDVSMLEKDCPSEFSLKL